MGCQICREKDPKPQPNKTNPESEVSSKPQALTAPVVRKSVFLLSPSELSRFESALDTMMENVNKEPGTSDFYRIACIHGWPPKKDSKYRSQSYCAHGQEEFPAWHRAYLLEFEQALRAADKKNGGDGNIGLPYWDWQGAPKTGDPLPAFLRKEKWANVREGLFKKKDHDEIFGKSPMRRNDPETIQAYMTQVDIRRQADLCLLEEQHFKFATTRWDDGPDVPIEEPHNNGHGIIGWPMENPSFASFDPIFYMHHANVDRLFEKYLRLYSDSLEEYKTHQHLLKEQDPKVWPDYFSQPLAPFINPFTKKDWMPVEAYVKSETLGYTYDNLPKDPLATENQLRIGQTFVIFNVNKVELEHSGMTIFLFLVKKNKEEKWVFPEIDYNIWHKHPNFAGMTCIFAGRDNQQCANCSHHPDIRVKINITNSLQNLNISREDAEIHYRFVYRGKVLLPEEEKAVSAPVIRGPYLENPNKELTLGSKGKDVIALQEYLNFIGLYEGEVTGEFDEKTQVALRKYQELNGLEPHGNGNSQTLQSLGNRKNDHHKEGLSQALHAGKAKIGYFIGIHPGYLKRPAVEADISKAFSQWSSALKVIKFEPVKSKEDADITIQWIEHSKDNKFVFDGKGGTLAMSTKNVLSLDLAEKWAVETGGDQKGGQVALFSVVLHEIGHCLGLTHSKNGQDVMAPFYDPSKKELSKGDVERIQEIYSA